jgi:monoamine oxidase
MRGEVIVIGGGAAGLAAADALARGGRRVLLLEARRRLGGRIWTRRPRGWAWPVELGAEFIHGRAPEILAARLPPAQAAMARAYIEGFHAADPGAISLRSLILGLRAERAIGGGQSYRLAAGYGPFVARLAAECRQAGVRIQTGAAVTAVRWAPGAVTVTAGGQLHRGAQAVVALAPALAEKRAALAGLAMGPAVRLVLRFRRRFWRGRQLHAGYAAGTFTFAPQAALRAWWLGPDQAPQLTAWAAGPAVWALPRGAGLAAAAVETLAAITGWSERRVRGELLGVHAHDWQRDRFSAGAYSYELAGGAGAFAELAKPLASTLFFAGEATEGHGHHATVHGALASGERAAREVLATA